MKTDTTTYRIKAQFGYYPGTFRAPQDGYLTIETYDPRTGRGGSAPLEFASVADVYDYLTAEGDGSDPDEGPSAEYDGNGKFSRAGTYYTAHGQHSRPVYTVVGRKSGRCTKSIIAACDAIAAI